MRTATGPAVSGRLIERLEPRAVMTYAVVIAILAFVLSNPVYLAVLALSVWLLIAAAGALRASRMYATAGAVAAVSVAVLNPLISRQGVTVLWEGPVLPVVGQFNITAEACAFGVGMGLRLFVVISAFALYATAVNPDAALRVLGRVSFGSALIMALAVRLFPAMTTDAKRIMDAQRSRGLRLDTGTRRARVAARKPIVDCLLLTSLERAVQIAESMESRGYGRTGRTSASLPSWQLRDWLVAAAALGALALGMAAAVFGPGRFEYYPALTGPVGPADAGLLPALAALLIFPALLAWGWMRSHWLRSRI